MNERALEILKRIEKLPNSSYGDYHYIEELIHIIDKVMGYEENHFSHRRWNSSEPQKVAEIIRRMVSRNLIIKSKSGTMFKLNNKAVIEFMKGE